MRIPEDRVAEQPKGRDVDARRRVPSPGRKRLMGWGRVVAGAMRISMGALR